MRYIRPTSAKPDCLDWPILFGSPEYTGTLPQKAQSCADCIKKGKNSKPIITKNYLGKLPKLSEPNEEVPLDFARPIPFREHKQNYYILVSVDRLTRYPHAQVFKGCDTEIAFKYLSEYCQSHGIPRSIRCDQAQAFKAREFEIFCKNKNVKLILAPAGDHRATGIVERLIPTKKRTNSRSGTRPSLVFSGSSYYSS